MTPTRRGIALGLPTSVILDDRDLRRIYDRQRRLLGRAMSARSETQLQRDIDNANARIESVIRRIEADRRRPAVPSELVAEVEKFRNGSGHRYVIVPPSSVPPELREAVLDGVQRACNRLGGIPQSSGTVPWIETPQVRYFRAALPGERADFTWEGRPIDGLHAHGTDTVDVRVGPDRTPAQCRNVVAHECFHWGATGSGGANRDEVAASAFAASIAVV